MPNWKKNVYSLGLGEVNRLSLGVLVAICFQRNLELHKIFYESRFQPYGDRDNDLWVHFLMGMDLIEGIVY